MAKNVETVIGDDIYFRGKLSFAKGLEIQGKLQGQIKTTGSLTISPTAQIKADIEAGNVTIQGRLVGNVVAQKGIELAKGSVVKGDLHTPDLSIQSGAKFCGHAAMETEKTL